MEEKEAKQDIKINSLEINFKAMFEQNSKEHLAINERLETIVDRMETMIEKMDKKYAPIIAWKIMTWGGGIIGAFLILFALNKLFIK